MINKSNLIQEKSFDFSLDIIKLYKKLEGQREFIISKQLLRSGTSIGANIEEAIGASSRKDFINKLHISLKEAFETRYWLKLLDKSNLITDLIKVDLINYLSKINNVINILVKIIKSSKENREIKK